MPRPKIELPYQYFPRSYHRRIYGALEEGCKHLCLVIHRRGGKTESLVSYMPIPMLEAKGNYSHVFPTLKQGREIVWDGIGRGGLRYLEHFPRPLLYGSPNKSELKVTLQDRDEPRAPGSTYQIHGTDHNVNSLVGGATRGVVFDEFSLQNPLGRDYAKPILAENGGWEIVVFTPRGENHAYDLYQFAQGDPQWHTEYLTVEDTRRDGPGEDGSPVVSYETIEQDRKEMLARGREDADAIIEQEYFLAWHVPIPGAYFAKEMRWLEQHGRITSVPYDPRLPTYSAWDIGINDLNAIWLFQPDPATGLIRFIDYMQGASIPLAPAPGKHWREGENWIGLLRQKPYEYDHSKLLVPLTRDSYEVHYGPHDLDNREYSSGKTRVSIAREHGLRFTVLPHPGPGGFEDGIAAARQLLRRSVFDKDKCKLGLSALRNFHREWDDDAQTYRNHPVHDWSSNGSAALRYAAVGLQPAPPPVAPKVHPHSFAAQLKHAKKGRR
jgi:phage terminase large subunit